MLALVLAAALTAAAPAECLRADPAETVVERKVLERGKAAALQVYAVSRREAESPWSYENSRVVIYEPAAPSSTPSGSRRAWKPISPRPGSGTSRSW